MPEPLNPDAELLTGDPCPCTWGQLFDLISWLDGKGLVSFDGQTLHSACDHTFRNTDEFLASNGLDVQAMHTWLCGYGGCCDCEVLLNVADRYVEAFGETRAE